MSKRTKKTVCGALSRKGTPCQKSPMEGSTRCKLHGGASLKGIDSPTYKHGGRSKYAKEQVMAKIKKYKNDQDVRDLRNELAILRGLLDSYITASNGDENHLLNEVSLTTIATLIRNIENLVSKLKIIEEGHTFTIKNVHNVMIQVVKIIKTRVRNKNERSLIAQDLRNIRYVSLN